MQTHHTTSPQLTSPPARDWGAADGEADATVGGAVVSKRKSLGVTCPPVISWIFKSIAACGIRRPLQYRFTAACDAPIIRAKSAPLIFFVWR